MRAVLLLTACALFLTMSCNSRTSDGPARTSTVSPSPAQHDIDISDLMLTADDVPSDVGSIGEPMLLSAEQFVQNALDGGQYTADEIRAWGVVANAVQFYNSSQPFPARGAQYILISVTITDSPTRMAALFPAARNALSRDAVEKDEAYPGRDVLEYEQLRGLSIGDEASGVHYISADPDDPVRFETHWVLFYRGRVAAAIQLRAPEGNVSLDEVVALAEKVASRIMLRLG